MDTFALRIDGGTQPRERLAEATVARYAEEMSQGLWDFSRSSDRPVAYYDGIDYWLGDGFHRLAAATGADKLDEFSQGLEIRQGTVRDAILYSVGANATHGYPRSNEDKRRAVSRLLEDPEWSKWSDREIGRRCFVTPTLVGKMRASLSGVDSEGAERTYTTKHGTMASMKTDAIGGKRKTAKPEKTSEPTAEAGSPAVAGGERQVIARELRIKRQEISSPAVASSGVLAYASYRGVLSPDAGETRITAEPVGELHTERVGELRTDPVGELRVDPSPPGAQAGNASDPGPEPERELFVTAIRPLLDGLKAEGKKNMATMCPGTVADLAAELEEVLVGWDFATFGKRAKRCRLCGEKIVSGKMVMVGKGPAHWTCQQRDEEFQRWLKTRGE